MGGGGLQEFRLYWVKISILMQYFICVKGNFEKKEPVLPTEKFSSLVLPRNMTVTTLQHHIIQFSLYYQSSDYPSEVKDKRKFQSFSSRSGCPCLREVVTYKRFKT